MNDPTPRRLGLAEYARFAYFTLAPVAAAGGGLALAPMQVVAGLAGLPGARLPQRRATQGFLVLLVGFFLWTAASAFWSPVSAFEQAGKLLGGAACGILFVATIARDETARRATRAAGGAFVFMLAALLLIEAFGDMPLNRMGQPDAATGLLLRNPGRGASVLVICLWGALASLAGGHRLERILCRVLVVLTGFISFQFGMDANALAFFLGFATYLSALAWPRFTVSALSIGLAGWLIAAPWITPLFASAPSLRAHLSPSWLMRADIWRYTSGRIQAEPWLGAGLDGSHAPTPMFHQGPYNFHGIPLHPHSASLQIWFETGAVGVLLIAGAIVLGGQILARSAAQNRIAIAGSCGVLASFGLIANVSYGIWQEWWLAVAFTAAGLAVAAWRRSRASP